MWLLSTDRAELHPFARHFDAVGGYAILSHTWSGDNEQTFEQVRLIGERCLKNGTNPRDDLELSEKIRKFCILASERGYRWAWVDSCCINKTSSSELSEAINSMYRWYKDSEVCLAYLVDVPNNCDLGSKGSAFRNSRWHKRAWTLQELIAPDSVIFLSSDWCELGSKAALATLLQEITRVNSKVLTGDDRPAEYSISARMSWASMRQATRVEDEAYCLMGLFGVSMPTNYGEGREAFFRLQNEIMKHNLDMSLFAFGFPHDHVDHGIVFQTRGNVDRNDARRYLLASSPRDLEDTFDYLPRLGSDADSQQYPPLSGLATVPFSPIELPSATVTSYGVQFRLPVATVDGFTIALLLCQSSEGHHFGLFLMKDHWAKDPTRPRYFVGCNYTHTSASPSSFHLARMCDLGDDLYNLRFNGKPVEATWHTIYVLATPSHFDSDCRTTPNLTMNCNPGSRFRFPRWLAARLTTLQFEVYQNWDESDKLQVIKILHRPKGRTIFISLGSCYIERRDPNKSPPLWARVDLLPSIKQGIDNHNCSEDHIDSESWAEFSKEFKDESNEIQDEEKRARVRLSFTSPKPKSLQLLTIHLELVGKVFEEILREYTISIPPLASLKMVTDTAAPPPNLNLAHIPPPQLHSQESMKTSMATPQTLPSLLPLPPTGASSHYLQNPSGSSTAGIYGVIGDDAAGASGQLDPEAPPVAQPPPSRPPVELLGVPSEKAPDNGKAQNGSEPRPQVNDIRTDIDPQSGTSDPIIEPIQLRPTLATTPSPSPLSVMVDSFKQAPHSNGHDPETHKPWSRASLIKGDAQSRAHAQTPSTSAKHELIPEDDAPLTVTQKRDVTTAFGTDTASLESQRQIKRLRKAAAAPPPPTRILRSTTRKATASTSHPSNEEPPPASSTSTQEHRRAANPTRTRTPGMKDLKRRRN